MFNDENELRNFVIKKLRSKLGEQWEILDTDSSFDIVLCKQCDKPILFFIELKYCKNHPIRLAPMQREIIRKNIAFFDKYLVWLMGDHETGKYILKSTQWIRDNVNPLEKNDQVNINLKRDKFNTEIRANGQVIGSIFDTIKLLLQML